MIRVVLAEDEPLLRAGIRALLEHDPEIRVVAEAGDGGVALALVRSRRPDVLLVDLRMPGVDGVDTVRRLRADRSLESTRALVLTTFDDREDVLSALRAGADGYLLKDIDADELRQAVRDVTDGKTVVASAVLLRVLDAAVQLRPPRPELISGLTAREVDVLTAVGRGRSNGEIAEELHLSPATVRTYISRILQRSASRDRAQLVVLAYESGLVGRAAP